MPAKTSKRYVAPVISDDPQSIQQAINKLYDDLNDLAMVLVQGQDETARRTAGSRGDIQLLEDKATGRAVLRGRTENGWVEVASADLSSAFEKKQS